MRELTIAGKTISDDSDAFIIAEVGNNHGGCVETCKQLFKAAKDCGADAVKLQKRDNKTLYTKAMYNKPYDNDNSYGATYGEHREYLEFGMEEYKELKAYAEELDIIFFATAFDIPSADFLRELDMPAYKIASGCLTDIPLIKHIATFGKPMIISTGGGSWEDVERTCLALYRQQVRSDIIASSFALLHCVATYPNQPEDMNLRIIETMRREHHDTVIGLSDHYNGTVMAEAGYVMGARIIEKHFTLNHTWKGTDHPLSLEPQGMETLVHNIRRLRLAMGDGEKRCLDEEKKAIEKMGKSIYPVRTIKEGERITLDMLCVKSPGGGWPPYELEKFDGMLVEKELSTDEPLKWGGKNEN